MLSRVDLIFFFFFAFGAYVHVVPYAPRLRFRLGETLPPILDLNSRVYLVTFLFL